MAVTKDKEMRTRINQRERIALWLIVFALRIVAPWEYDHQYKECLERLDEVLKDNE